VSNVDDLARFLIMHLSGGDSVLAPATVADMHRVHAPLGDGSGGMGLGFRVDRRNGRPFFCHGGDGSGYTTFIGGHPEERVGVVVLMNTAGAQEARSAIARAALDSVLDDAPRRTRPAVTVRPPKGRYRSTFWEVPAEVAERHGAPVVTMAPGRIAFAESVSTLSPAGGSRWYADGGMFDGWELDFDTSTGDRRFFGGAYPFEFMADDTPVTTLPTVVDERGELTGTWAGTLDTPFGAIPLELDVQLGKVALGVMGSDGLDTDAETRDGWIRARFELDLAGFGPIVLFVRLGLVAGRLEGMLYVRHEGGEASLPAVLESPTQNFT
jgi:hypothetical protein